MYSYFWCQTSSVSPRAPDPVRSGWFSGRSIPKKKILMNFPESSFNGILNILYRSRSRALDPDSETRSATLEKRGSTALWEKYIIFTVLGGKYIIFEMIGGGGLSKLLEDYNIIYIIYTQCRIPYELRLHRDAEHEGIR